MSFLKSNNTTSLISLAFKDLFVECQPCILFREYPKIQIQVPYPLLSVLTTFIAKTNYRTFHIHHLYRPIFFQLFEFGVKVLTKKSTKGFIENLKYLFKINPELSRRSLIINLKGGLK